MPLKARQSPFHSSVTLFEPEHELGEGSMSQTPPRRSKRTRTCLQTVSDIEEAVPSSPTEGKPHKTAVKRRKTTAEKAKKVEEPDETFSNKRNSSQSPKKAKPIQMFLEVPHPAPEHWEETYNAIKEMRQKVVAPVDNMGCDTAQLHEVDPKVSCARKLH